MLTHEDAVKMLEQAIEREGSQTRYATRVGETQPRVSSMICGRLALSDKVLKDLQIKKIKEPFFELTYS